MKPRHQRNILLIDDDPLFGNVLSRKAFARGVHVDYRASLIDAMYGGYLEGYDAAIIDCVMPSLDGFEVSRYLSTFLGHIPVVLVSQSHGQLRQYMHDPCGAAAFVTKDQGAEAILTAAIGLLKKAQIPRRDGVVPAA